MIPLAGNHRLRPGRSTPFEMSQNRALSRSKSARDFWPPLETGQRGASCGSLRPHVHTRTANHFAADSCDAGIRHPPGLDDQVTGQRNRLRRFPTGEAGETAGGRAPPGDRRGAGVALGSLGPISGGPARDTPELEHLGVGFVSLNEALELTTRSAPPTRKSLHSLENPGDTPSG